MDYTLHYVTPKGLVVDAGTWNTHAHQEVLLHKMIGENPDVIFFYTIQSTDIF